MSTTDETAEKAAPDEDDLDVIAFQRSKERHEAKIREDAAWKQRALAAEADRDALQAQLEALANVAVPDEDPVRVQQEADYWKSVGGTA